MLRDFHITPDTCVANDTFPTTASIKYNYDSTKTGEVSPADVPAPQSGLIAQTAKQLNFQIGSEIDPIEVARVTHGEAVLSLRTVLHRYFPAQAVAPVTNATTAPMRGFFIPRIQPFRGCDTGTSTYINNMLHPITYLACAYFGTAGSTRARIVPIPWISVTSAGHHAPEAQTLRVMPGSAIYNTLYSPTSAGLRTTFTDLSNWSWAHVYDFRGLNITRVTENQAVEIPASPGAVLQYTYFDLTTTTKVPGIDVFVDVQSTTQIGYDVYQASSDDFSLVGYVGPPVMYSYYNKAV